MVAGLRQLPINFIQCKLHIYMYICKHFIAIGIQIIVLLPMLHGSKLTRFEASISVLGLTLDLLSPTPYLSN